MTVKVPQKQKAGKRCIHFSFFFFLICYCVILFFLFWSCVYKLTEREAEHLRSFPCPNIIANLLQRVSDSTAVSSCPVHACVLGTLFPGSWCRAPCCLSLHLHHNNITWVLLIPRFWDLCVGLSPCQSKLMICDGSAAARCLSPKCSVLF